ncbi:DnaA N-terminal domain-containing protein [Jannaschia donghaensis]|uniref:DnaA N-terminal domain-containing protein n=1 Tax=Jannaschia donghaensis TaxID=420998 RepID=A0A0M6YEB2_9RHOB|nr:DnaA N-terminal domain-containing protein [Jannaschia donghaensis]CTQ48035.1 hypothetical protein JDO7802_00029 [Jannaschia donghaensis]
MGLGQISHGRQALTGRSSAAIKYDVLTALGAWACNGDKHAQRSVLRLITLITARYNWQDDTLTTGQREIATLWSVDQRTVKREMARMRDLGWLILKRPAARGRVACHGLGLDAIFAQTQSCWTNVGPDYVARMTITPTADTAPNVVAFPTLADGAWGRIAAQLQAEDAGLFNAWFASLVSLGERDGVLRLKPPSRFHGSFVRTHYIGHLQVLAQQQGLTVDLVE